MRLCIKSAFVMSLVLIVGCTATFPFDPSGEFLPFGDSLKTIQENLEDFLTDPFGIKPYPVIVGGDSERIYYATNLTDVKIDFPGPTNDMVLPGFWGPSNLYKYEDGERAMLRTWAPAAALGSTATDGVHAVYTQYTTPLADNDVQVTACEMYFGEPWTLYDSSEADPNAYIGEVVLSNARVAFVVGNYYPGDSAIRIVDVADGQLVLDVEVGQWSSYALRGDLLAYTTEFEEEKVRLYLLDLSSDEDAVLLAELPAFRSVDHVYITKNKVVWTESDEGYVSAGVKAYDLASGDVQAWADAIDGWMTGAADDCYLTEEYVTGDNGVTSRIIVRLHEADGGERKLGDFRADGLAGQACILGDRAVFVNDERRIVVAPLDGGDRFNFRPF